VVELSECYGGRTSLVLSSIQTFLSGLGLTLLGAEVLEVTLSILRCAGYSLKSFQSGQPLSIEY